MSNLDSKISSLMAGQSLITSIPSNIICTVERSGDGNFLRFVRTYENGSFEVYKTVGFYYV
jgi:hypothetical protein